MEIACAEAENHGGNAAAGAVIACEVMQWTGQGKSRNRNPQEIRTAQQQAVYSGVHFIQRLHRCFHQNQ